MLGEQPGSGRRIGYHTADHLPKLLLALELAQAAVAPQVALSLIATSWDDRLQPLFQEANEALVRGTSDVLLLLAGITEMVERDGAIPVIANNEGGQARRVANGAETITSVPGRALVINLTARLRRFHEALIEIYPQPEDHALDRRREKAEGETKNSRPRPDQSTSERPHEQEEAAMIAAAKPEAEDIAVLEKAGLRVMVAKHRF